MINKILLLFTIFPFYLTSQIISIKVIGVDEIGIQNVNLSINGNPVSKTDSLGIISINIDSLENDITLEKEGYLEKSIKLENLTIDKTNILTLEQGVHLSEAIIKGSNSRRKRIFLGQKQTMNARFIPIAGMESSLRIKNTLKEEAKIENVILYLHKTKKNVSLTNLAINFYKVDSIGMIGKKINNKPLIYRPKRKNRGKRYINVSDLNLKFPLNGIFVSIKWLPNGTINESVGPSLRMSTYTKESLSFSRFNDGIWVIASQRSKTTNGIGNYMIGLDVLVKD